MVREHTLASGRATKGQVQAHFALYSTITSRTYSNTMLHSASRFDMGKRLFYASGKTVRNSPTHIEALEHSELFEITMIPLRYEYQSQILTIRKVQPRQGESHAPKCVLNALPLHHLTSQPANISNLRQLVQGLSRTWIHPQDMPATD